MNRRHPQLPIPKSGPNPWRPFRVPIIRKSSGPSFRRHFWIPGVTSPRSPILRRWTHREGLDHPTPVYYIREVLHDAKMRYLEVHKLLMQFSLLPRNCATTSKLTRSQW
jgi:hypothetical protein